MALEVKTHKNTDPPHKALVCPVTLRQPHIRCAPAAIPIQVESGTTNRRCPTALLTCNDVCSRPPVRIRFGNGEPEQAWPQEPGDRAISTTGPVAFLVHFGR